ncbi:MAG TPA: hypothetical protein VIP70_12570 [Nitrososphaeraceae archaeon]
MPIDTEPYNGLAMMGKKEGRKGTRNGSHDQCIKTWNKVRADKKKK